MIMQVEVGASSPHVPGSIHERTHHRSSKGPSSVDLFLEDEGQQYGNMEDLSCQNTGYLFGGVVW